MNIERPMLPLRVDGRPVLGSLFNKLVLAGMSILETTLAIEIQKQSLLKVLFQYANTIKHEHPKI